MATRADLLTEAKKRGILSQKQVAMLDEANRRGLLDNGQPENQETPQRQAGPMIPGESTSTVTGQPVTEEEMLRSGAGEGQQMISNVPGSTLEFGKGLYNIVRHPIETGKGVGKLALGVGAKAIPGEQPFEEYANAFGRMYKERYGADFRNTIKEDPVGVLADFAGFLSLGGGALRTMGAAGKAAKIPQAAKLSQAGKAVQQAGAAIEPINLAKQTIVKPVTSTISKKLPPKLYKQSAKFSSSLPEAKRDELAKLAVEKGIMPTAKGIDKANEFIQKFDNEIDTIIKQIDTKGKRANKRVLFKYLNKLKKEMGGVKLEGTKDVNVISKIEKEFRLHLRKINKKYLTADELQEFKKDIYRRVRYDKKRGSLTVPKELTAKSMARAAKEQLEKMHPELKGVNAKYGPMKDLLDAIESRAAIIEGSQLVSFDVPVKAAAGGALLGPAGKVAGAGIGILDKPYIKARVALLLEKIRKYQPKESVTGATVRSAAREGDRTNKEPKLKKASIQEKKVGKYKVSEINKIKSTYPKAKKEKDGFYYVMKDGVKNRITF